MEYKIGDVINLRNDAGVFKVELKRKMETIDVIRGTNDKDLFFEGFMRLEVHQKDCYHYVITMTSREASEEDGTIIVCLLSTIDETVEYYLGQIVQYEEKEDAFELMK